MLVWALATLELALGMPLAGWPSLSYLPIAVRITGFFTLHPTSFSGPPPSPLTALRWAWGPTALLYQLIMSRGPGPTS